MSDATTLRLNDMRFFGRIGHTEEERTVGTHVQVDIEMGLDLQGQPRHELSATIDYRQVHARIGEVITQGSHPLLEGLAQEILEALEAFAWTHVVVRVRKPDPPIDARMGSAEVEVRRSRDQDG